MTKKLKQGDKKRRYTPDLSKSYPQAVCSGHSLFFQVVKALIRGLFILNSIIVDALDFIPERGHLYFKLTLSHQFPA